MSDFFKEISKKYYQVRAFSTFESVLLIPAISLLIFGALDVSRVLQAYSALDEGVNESLRCVFPTDGECSYNENTNQRPRYNFYSTTPNIQWLRRRNRFVTDVSWLNKPLSTYSDFRPTVIGEFNYTVPPTAMRVRRETPVGSIRFRHLIMQASGPYVVNPNSPNLHHNATNNLRFVFGSLNPDRGKNYPSLSFNVRGSLSIGPGNNSDELITRGFQTETLPNTASMPCYRGNGFNEFVAKKNRQARYGTNCNTDWVPFAFYLEGRQLSRAGGTLELYVQNVINQDMLARIRGGGTVNLNSWLSLGGQRFSDNSGVGERNANFVPRGVRRWTGGFGGKNYPEYGMYSKLYARPGKNIRIKLVLKHNSGDSSNASWRPTSLTIFPPVMSHFKSDQRLQCPSVTEIKKCNVNYPNTNTKVPRNGRINFRQESPIIEHRNLACDSSSLSGNSAYLKVGWPNCSTCSLENNPNLKACLGARDTHGKRKNIKCISNCNYDSSLKNCTNRIDLSELNPGVSGNPNISGSLANREAQAICGIPKEDTKIFSLSELGGSFREYQFVFPDEEFSYLQQDCSMPRKPNSFPLKYSRFKKYAFNSVNSTNVKHEDPNKSPNELKKDSKYSCFEVDGFTFDSNQITDLPGDSMYKGNEFYTCGCEEKANKRVYTDSAYQEKFSDLELFTKTKCLETSPLLVNSNEGDLCPPPIPKITQVEEWKLVEGGPFFAGQVPDICSNENVSCKSEFYDYVGGGDMSGEEDYKNKALNIAHLATNTLAPWISSDCSDGKTCSKFELETEGDSVKITGSAEIPLTILGNYKIPISVKGKRKEEKYF